MHPSSERALANRPLNEIPRRLVVLVMCMLGWVVLVGVSRGDNLEQELLRASVKILVTPEHGDPDRNHGAGVILGSDRPDHALIVTAAHVVGDQFDEIRVSFFPYSETYHTSNAVEVVNRMDEQDLMLLRVRLPNRGSFRSIAGLKSSQPTPFRGYTCGCDDDLPTVEPVTITARRERKASPKAPCWEVKPPSRRGRSGGPLVDVQLTLLGICHGGNSETGLYVAATEIRPLVKGASLPKLSRLNVSRRYEANLTGKVEKVRWIDPSARIVEADLSLNVHVPDLMAHEAPFRCVVECANVELVDSSSTTFLIENGEALTQELAIQWKAERDRPLPVKVFAETLDGNKLLCSTEINLAVPPPAKTRVQVTAKSLTLPQWSDLADGIADFDVELEVNVDGVLGENSRLIVTAPPGVRRLDLSDSMIRPGSQTIQMSVSSQLPVAQACQLPFQLSATCDGPVTLVVDKTLIVEANGPDPVQAVLLVHGKPMKSPLRLVPRKGERLAFEASVGILGQVAENSASFAEFETNIHQRSHQTQRSTYGESQVIELDNQEIWTRASFWSDSINNVEVQLTPTSTHGAINGNHYKISLVVPAVFKTYLLYGSIGALVLSVVVIGVSMARMLVTSHTFDLVDNDQPGAWPGPSYYSSGAPGFHDVPLPSSTLSSSRGASI